MTTSADTPRSCSGLSWICMKLLLLPPRPPAKPVMLCTAGSASTTLRSASSLGTVAWNEVP